MLQRRGPGLSAVALTLPQLGTQRTEYNEWWAIDLTVDRPPATLRAPSYSQETRY